MSSSDATLTKPAEAATTAATADAATATTPADPTALEHGDLLAHDAVPAALIAMREIWKTYQQGRLLRRAAR